MPQTAEHDHPEDTIEHTMKTPNFTMEKFSAILTVNITVLDIRIHQNVGTYVSNNSAGGSSLLLNVYWL
jgi:uncharacterized lipoprotein YajG